MNEIVTYHNRLNGLDFTGFSKVDYDLFMAIATQMRDKGRTTVRLSFNQLRGLTNYNQNSQARFLSDLDRSYKKFLNLLIKIGDDNHYVVFTMFEKFEVKSDEEWVELSASPMFDEVLNNLFGEFMQFRLDEFINLRSTYAKRMYTLLKQWKFKGEFTWDTDDWRRELSVPKSYSMSKIDRFVLGPIMEELPAYFKDLKVEKIKEGPRGKITKLKFSFEKEAHRPKKKKSNHDKLTDFEALRDRALAEGDKEAAKKYQHWADGVVAGTWKDIYDRERAYEKQKKQRSDDGGRFKKLLKNWLGN